MSSSGSSRPWMCAISRSYGSGTPQSYADRRPTDLTQEFLRYILTAMGPSVEARGQGPRGPGRPGPTGDRRRARGLGSQTRRAPRPDRLDIEPLDVPPRRARGRGDRGPLPVERGRSSPVRLPAATGAAGAPVAWSGPAAGALRLLAELGPIAARRCDLAARDRRVGNVGRHAPCGARVHPGAVAAASRAGLDLTSARPRHLTDVVEPPELVVTVCDRAREELATADDWLHWSVPDPVEAGTRRAFDAVVGDLRHRITALVGKPT